jgi:hypothetical protein
MSPHTFPGPWQVEPAEDGNFIVRDADGFVLARVHAKTEKVMRGEYFSPAEALTTAMVIAKLPLILISS